MEILHQKQQIRFQIVECLPDSRVHQNKKGSLILTLVEATIGILLSNRCKKPR